MPSAIQLKVDERRKELISMGYKPKVVDLALEWAIGSAEGMANYYTKTDLGGEEQQKMVLKMLPTYLKDCEKWMQSFGNQPSYPSPKKS
jgi:hypothetical protein